MTAPDPNKPVRDLLTVFALICVYVCLNFYAALCLR